MDEKTDFTEDIVSDIELPEDYLDGNDGEFSFDEEGRFVHDDFSEQSEDNSLDNAQTDGNSAPSDDTQKDEKASAVVVEPEHIEGDFVKERKKIIYRLQDFEGPIDLLYELVKASKIAIEEIFISDVTSQYVEILRNTPKEEFDYEYAGDFITMAADLIYLKSTYTLPKEGEEESNGEEYSEHDLLMFKVKQFAIMKEQSEKMREIETINRFYRPPTYTEKDYRVALVNFSLPKLVEAFAKVLATADKHKQEVIPKKVMKDRFSVHDQMVYITTMISVRRQMKFTELFEPDYDKSDIVTTFLAVLELLKYGRLRAVQEEVFGDIDIFAIDGTEDLPIDFEEDDDGKY